MIHFLHDVMVHRVSVPFAVALTCNMSTICGRLRESFLEGHPGVPHACKIVITDPFVTQELDLPGQVGNLAGDQPGPIHHGPHPRLGGQ